MIEPSLLELLACPACDDRPPLTEEDSDLVCSSCGRRYPVQDGVPNLLVEDGN